MKREPKLGDLVSWRDDAGHAHPAIVTTLLVDAKTGKQEGQVTLTVFSRYSTECNVVADQGTGPEQWHF